MTVDVSTKELWSLFARMSDVIDSHRRYAKPAGVQTPVVVRWDEVIIKASRNPTVVFRMAVLNCLKVFEDLFIRQRHIDTAILEEFIQYCQKERGVEVVVAELRNENSDGPLPDRFVKCTIRMNGYAFSYWNDAFLPSMKVEELS